MNLDKRYDRDAYLDFLKSFLPDFSEDIRDVDAEKLQVTKEAHFLGESEELDLAVFELTHTSSSDARVSLSMDGFKLMKSSATYRALIVYCSANSDDWRFSLMTATPDLDEKGKVVRKLSNPRRFSFFLGPNAKVNTPTKFLIKDGAVSDFEDLQSRFSLEVVNKVFYKQISEKFTQLVGGTLGTGKKQKTYEPLIKLPSQSEKSQANMEFGVRLIGRIIFCWFLREKKSEAGQPLMPKELLSLEAVSEHSDYYHSVLEPIFFEVLNKEHRARRDEYSGEPYSHIPYLNGGLFAPHTDDYYKRPNGEQSIYHNTLVIPDSWLKELFEILETYNFTIDENTSFDEELSIDPEMLGRIFENLLAEINPETGESARKSTGSYYTPRVIVDYMVDESLLLYLQEHTDIAEDKLRAVISYDLSDDAEHPLDEGEKKMIVQNLGKLKLLDPACGSGAFPIGALQKIVFVLQQIDPDGKHWLQKQLENAQPEFRRDIERKFSNQELDFLRKLGIIRECIFGVDIQPIATEIARLRCFLTLIVDERIDDTADNRGIKPLPNLDFKFVTANSLIDLPKLEESQQMQAFDNWEAIDELKAIRDEYFTAEGIDREKLKTEFVTAQNRIIHQLREEHGWIGVSKAELSNKLTSWEPFSHKATDWFDPEWMFGISEGFDIVIANPPYVRIQSISKVDKEQVKYLKEHYIAAKKGNYDIYVVFVENGLKLMKEDGCLSYILPHKFFTSQYGEPLRELVTKQSYLNHIVHFKDQQIFEGATTYTCLLFLGKKEENSLSFSEVSNLSNWYSTKESNTEIFLNSKMGKRPWNFVLGDAKGVFGRLDSFPTVLGDVTDIFQGIVTSADPIYILKNVDKSENKHVVYSDYLDTEIEMEKAFLKPFIKDVTINPYKDVQGSHLLLFPYIENHLVSWENIKEQSPLTASYLEKCKEALAGRENGKMKHEKWYGYVYPKNLQKFQGSKLIVQVISKRARYSIDHSGVYFTGGGNGPYYGICINSANTEFSIEYLCGILNSKLADFYLHKISTTFRGGYWSYGKQFIERIPIPSPSAHNKKSVENLVRDISQDRENGIDISKKTKELDHIVYEIFELSGEETNLIESTSKN